MTSEFQWDKAARTLLSMTKQGDLKWIVDHDISRLRGNVSGKAYTAKHEGNTIAIYEYKYPFYNEDLDNYTLVPDVSIEFVGFDGALEWQWPKVESRWDLLESVRYKTSGADDFLRKMLSKTTKSST